jgi:hypothetical protein
MTPPLPDAPALQALWNLPYPLLVLDDEMRLCSHNGAAEQLLSESERQRVGRKCGEVLQCLHALRADDCCGHTEHCPTCAVRNSAVQAQREQATVQARVSIQRGPDPDQLVHMLLTAVGFTHDGRRRALVMLQDIPELAAFAGLIPVCAVCHKMRDEAGEWHDLAPYLYQRFDLAVMHSLCPECGRRSNR